MAKTKAELQALANEQGVDGVDEDAQTKDEMIATLEAAGVSADGGDDSDVADADERDASTNDITERMAGGTPGGASESQQPPSVARASGIPGIGAPTLPDLDEVTALGVRPRYAGPRNPALEYDDDAKG